MRVHACKRKKSAAVMIVVGLILTLVSSANLFLILVDGSSHQYFFALSHSMEPAIGKGVCGG